MVAIICFSNSIETNYWVEFPNTNMGGGNGARDPARFHT